MAKLPAILDRFYWFTQYHKHFYRDGGWWDATKWLENTLLKLKTAKCNQISHKTAKIMANITSPASCVVIYNLLCTCPVEIKPLKTTQALVNV